MTADSGEMRNVTMTPSHSGGESMNPSQYRAHRIGCPRGSSGAAMMTARRPRQFTRSDVTRGISNVASLTVCACDTL